MHHSLPFFFLIFLSSSHFFFCWEKKWKFFFFFFFSNAFFRSSHTPPFNANELYSEIASRGERMKSFGSFKWAFIAEQKERKKFLCHHPTNKMKKMKKKSREKKSRIGKTSENKCFNRETVFEWCFSLLNFHLHLFLFCLLPACLPACLLNEKNVSFSHSFAI